MTTVGVAVVCPAPEEEQRLALAAILYVRPGGREPSSRSRGTA